MPVDVHIDNNSDQALTAVVYGRHVGTGVTTIVGEPTGFLVPNNDKAHIVVSDTVVGEANVELTTPPVVVLYTPGVYDPATSKVVRTFTLDWSLGTTVKVVPALAWPATAWVLMMVFFWISIALVIALLAVMALGPAPVSANVERLEKGSRRKRLREETAF